MKWDKKYEPVIIENDANKAKDAIKDGYQVIHADGFFEKLMNMLLQKGNIVAMLTLRSSDIDNIYFILNAKSLTHNSRIFSRMNQVELRPQYKASKVYGLIVPCAVIDQKIFSFLGIHIKAELFVKN